MTTEDHHAERVPATPRATSLLLALVLLAIGLGTMVGERIERDGGLGFDGRRYAAIARAPEAATIGKASNRYDLQRVAPSLAVAAGLRVLRLPADAPRIVAGFQILNVACVVVAAWLWGLIVRRLGLTGRSLWLGAIAIFANVAVLKQTPYDPVMTDPAALAIGMALLYAYVRDSLALLVTIAIVGAFTWPVALALSVPLIVWPRGCAPLAGRTSWRLAALIAASVVCGIIVVFCVGYFVKGVRTAGYGGVAPAIPALIPLAMIGFATTLAPALIVLLRGLDVPYIAGVVRAVPLRRASAAIAAVASVSFLVATWQSPTAHPVLTARGFLWTLAFTAMARPLITLVAHIIYFGPWVALLLVYWPSVAAVIRRDGAGSLAFMAGAVILAMLPESRQSIMALPWFALFFVRALDTTRLPRAIVPTLGALSLLTSRAWLSVGPGTARDLAQLHAYFLQHGPYMTATDYAWQTLFATSCLIAAAAFARRVPERRRARR